jgi:hypothetical protein
MGNIEQHSALATPEDQGLTRNDVLDPYRFFPEVSVIHDVGSRSDPAGRILPPI